MCAKEAIPQYTRNLVNLIKDVRKEFKAPKLPVVIGYLLMSARAARIRVEW